MTILEIHDGNPLLDGRQSENAMMVRRGLQRLFHEQKQASLPELTLSSGRRADLIILSPKGVITIVEIKSSIEDFKVDNKWSEYLEFCDFFYFATHAGVPADIFPRDEGLILADRFGAEIIQPAKETRLNGAKRKSIIQRFASSSAERLLTAEWKATGDL